jgi:3-hydroxyacyl-[acyl-carrier-protein] dehydratase
MKFQLVDHILEHDDDRIVTLKQVSLAEEYLADHFPTFPILPGVLMIEAMVQAARTLLASHGDPRLVLGEVKALKFGSMVRPGESLRVEVKLLRREEDGRFACRGTGLVVRHGSDGNDAGPSAGETAVSGRFTMRPLTVR